MLCVADYLDALQWVRSIGGLPAAIAKSEANLATIKGFVDAKPWIDFLAKESDQISNTSVCLSLDLDADQVKQMVSLLAEEAVAFDIGAYRDAPAGLRIWCGATVEQSDIEALLPWLEWAYTEVAQ
jgi:phosphoserine aminotransferase